MHYPKWLPEKWRPLWDRPWGFRARHSRGYKRLLWRHGHVTRHFMRSEWNCHDGTPVPDDLRHNAQRHGGNLERFRHLLGGVALPILSAYRTPAYNAQIGGASASRHMSADATDFSSSTVNAVGRSRWYAAADRVFVNGGVGDYPSGSAHLDSRGYRARWTSF